MDTARAHARRRRALLVTAAATALLLLPSPPAGGWGTLTGGLNLSDGQRSNLRWMLENYGVDPTTKVAEMNTRAGAHPIHQFIVYQAWLTLQADPAVADGASGLPDVKAINAWDGIERCEHGMKPGVHDLVGDPRLVPNVPGAGGPGADSELASETPLAFNALYNGRAHYWSPWLVDGQAPTAAGVNYSRLVQAVAEGQDANQLGHYAAYMGHYIADPTSAKHADAFTLDLASVNKLVAIAQRWHAAASDDLRGWIAHGTVTEAVQVLQQRAGALNPGLASAYWSRVNAHIGRSGPDTLLRRESFYKVDIPPSTLRSAVACYLHELNAWKVQADAGGAKSLDAFYTYFDPFYFNGPTFDHWLAAPSFDLCTPGSEHLTWETRPAQYQTVQEWMPKKEPLLGAGDPHRHYLTLDRPREVHGPDPEAARKAREAAVADLVRRCSQEAHGVVGDARDFQPEHLAHLKMGIRCVATALRGSVTALRAEAWGRRVGDGNTDVRVQLEVKNLAPKPATLVAADVFLRDPGTGKLATRPGWRVALGGRAVGAEPVSVGVLVQGVPEGVDPRHLVIDLHGDVQGTPDSGWRRVSVDDWGTRRVTNPGAGAALAGGRKGPIDVAVVMDTTGSMQSSIDSLRRNAIASIRKLRAHTDDIRMALTTFRDLEEEDDRPHFEVHSFTRDLEARFAAMNGLSADGGGDTPEDQLHGISAALKLWEGEEPDPDRVPTKIIVVITDAPAKSPDSAGNTFESISRRAFEVDPAHVYPIVVGGDRDAREHADRLAADTTGQVLTASSGDEVANALLSAVGTAAVVHAAPAAAPTGGPPRALLLGVGGALLLLGAAFTLLALLALAGALRPSPQELPMAELTEADKARIRAEEEARAKAMLEERYRQQVRAELEGQRSEPPPAPATASPAAAPARVARPPGRGTAALWVPAVLFCLGGIALLVWGLAAAGPGGTAIGGVSPPEGPADLEVVAAPTGPLAAAPAARWDPAELGFTGLELGPDGALREVPRPGYGTREELVRAVAAHEAAPTPTPTPRLADLEAGVAAPAGVDTLLRWVPPDAFLILGADFAQARRAPVLGRFRDAVFELLELQRPLADLARASGIDLSGRAEYAVFAFPEAALRDSEAFLVAIEGPYDGPHIESWLRGLQPGRVSTRRSAAGTVLDFGAGGVVLADGHLMTAARGTFAAAQLARSGNSALVSGALSEPLRVARAAPAGFAVMRFPASLREELREEAPELAPAQWLRLRVAVAGGTLRAELTAGGLPDARAAARLRQRVEALREGPGALLLADVTLTTEGSAVHARLTLDEAGVRRWMAAAKLLDP